VKFLITALLVLNLAFSGYLFFRLENLMIPEEKAGEYLIRQEAPDLGGYATISYVNELLGKPTPMPAATSTPSPTSVIAPKPSAATKKTEVSYLPIGGSLTTTSTDWTDVPGSDFWADFSTDFGSDAQVSWEATLKVEAASGRVTARLMDTTHGIELLESQVFTELGVLTSVTSGRIYPWAGKNLYRVQIRSLIPTAASFDGGRVKVVY
jgi:hypothetical protein